MRINTYDIRYIKAGNNVEILVHNCSYDLNALNLRHSMRTITPEQPLSVHFN